MPRYPELDLLRTLAVLGMIVYHAAYDLETIYHWDISVLTGTWKLFQRIIAGTFLLLVGISFAVSWERAQRRMAQATFWQLYRKYLQRGTLTLLCALLVTIVTSIALPTMYIRFGILHLIGTAILLLPFFTVLHLWNALPALIMLVLGFSLIGTPVETAWLLPLGFVPPHFVTLDYFPLLPWLGVILLGYCTGLLLYIPEKHPNTREPPTQKVLSVLTWPGRHALLIYMVHQPIVLLVLWGVEGRI